jgi:transposase
VVGMDIHRTFAEVVFWEAGRLRSAGRVDMTRSGLEGFGRSLSKEDEIVNRQRCGCSARMLRE